ncbi:MAG: hypothetical protein AAGD23_08260 [Pseudomonadota bacterium]
MTSKGRELKDTELDQVTGGFTVSNSLFARGGKGVSEVGLGSGRDGDRPKSTFTGDEHEKNGNMRNEHNGAA